MSELGEEDFGSTTAVVAWVRRRITPGALWTGLVTFVSAIVLTVGWWHATQTSIKSLQEFKTTQEARDAAQEARDEARMQRDEVRAEDLQKIGTQLAVMTAKIEDIATEVDRQRDWRENIETAAESPPHARRRR